MWTAFASLNHRLIWAAAAASMALMACGGGADDASTTRSNTVQAGLESTASPRSTALATTTAAATVGEAAAAPAQSDNTPPSGYTSCAVEGQRCSFSGAANVVYGAGDTWTAARSYSGGVDCNNATFGDPLYGVVKACYFSASSPPPPPPPPPPPSEEQPPAGYTRCAAENQRCSFSGAANVVYGARSTWSPPRSFSGGVDCGNGVFGDPLYGVVKACYVNAVTPTPPPPPPPPPLPTITQTFSATSADFPSPERGFYGWSGSDFVTAYDPGSVKVTSDAGMRLVMALVQLDSYRNADLTADWLRALDASFAKVRAAGMKVTLAVSYDFTEAGKDASATQIKRHLEQLKPVLAANADVIPYMRAGFIGAWGEWHSSQSGNSCGYNSPANITCDVANANRVIVRDALFANVPSTTQIGFRYPTDLQKWYPTPKQQSRAGMHNDCFLAGPTDTGTYEATGSRAYAQALSENAAFGGETCDNAGKPARDTCPDILREGAQYHVAWLNINYGPAFISAWRAGGCFNEVSRSIGYRLQLDAISHAASVARGNTLPVVVDLRNVGWARIFSDRPLVVTLKNVATGNTITAAASNLRELSSQATTSTRVSVNVAIPNSAPTGDYEIALGAPDVFAALASDARFAVRFANADNASLRQAWDASGGVFKTGSVVSVR